MNKKYLITIVGPTAIGKTALSVQLARHFQTEIISADSRQFFQEMKIGTAVPTEEELALAPHHFIQQKSVAEGYSVGDFERDALLELQQLFREKDIVVLVGGSGLYVDAVVKGLDQFPEVDPEVRKNLNNTLKSGGIENLQEQLKKLDPQYFSEVDIQNPHRLIRALEVCIGTGRPYSSFRNRTEAERAFQSIFVGLTADRQLVYNRINQRVDLMMEKGLLDEVKNLSPYREYNALNTVGYKELFRYLDGEWDLETAVNEIKKNTRRFAKRQFTWFKRNPEIKWFEYNTPSEEIALYVETRVSI